MVVTMSILSVILTVGIGLIHLLMRMERDGAKEVWHGRTLSRLSDAWRRDVHAARDARGDAAAETGDRILLRLPELVEITYAADGATVRRTVTQGAAVRHRDSFHFPQGSSIRLETGGEPTFARIVIVRPALPEKASRDSALAETAGRVTTIEAVVSRDLRYRSTEAAQ
jgi:hypothetical protein